MDPPRSASRRALILRAAVLLALLCVHPPGAAGQTEDVTLSEVKQLYADGQWTKILEAVPAGGRISPELNYYRGLALAKLARWPEAHAAFASGEHINPGDKRFPIELAGVDFKRERYAEAESHLRRALRLDPNEAYALNFLATLYLLDQNLHAAVKVWNRIDKPQVESVRADPEPRMRPALLDQAFAFSPASVLKANDLETSRARLDMLGVFPQFHFELQPQSVDNEKYDLVLRARERNGWGDSKFAGLLGLLGGLPYSTVYPQWWNIHGKALNFTSLVRWDDNKRRLSLSLGSPLRQNPNWHYELFADARDENWVLTDTFNPNPEQSFNLQKVEAGTRVRSVINGHWNWWTGAIVARRVFRDLGAAAPIFTTGSSLAYELGTGYEFLDLPERRLTLKSSFDGQIGHLFAPGAGVFSKSRGELQLRWFPRPRGNDYEIVSQFSAGKTTGSVPFDELFILGLERDNDLALRGHIGTRAGKKGSAPLGPACVLGNWEINKRIFDTGYFSLRLAPFLDNGKIFDASGRFASRQWLWDTGAQAKVRVLGGATVVFTYGKDLRSGRNSYYATLER